MRTTSILRRCSELLGPEEQILAATRATPAERLPSSFGATVLAMIPWSRSGSATMTPDLAPIMEHRQVLIAHTQQRFAFFGLGPLARPIGPIVSLGCDQVLGASLGTTIALAMSLDELTLRLADGAELRFVVAPPHTEDAAGFISTVTSRRGRLG